VGYPRLAHSQCLFRLLSLKVRRELPNLQTFGLESFLVPQPAPHITSSGVLSYSHIEGSGGSGSTFFSLRGWLARRCEPVHRFERMLSLLPALHYNYGIHMNITLLQQCPLSTYTYATLSQTTSAPFPQLQELLQGFAARTASSACL
jgi:hypothetical protein